jgi:predicted RNA-binding protein with PUA-like domain
MAKSYWLMKSEPDVYSLDLLEKQGTTWWEGVRNYQARNYMLKDMKVGDEVLFYHSSCEPPGIAGLAVVSAAALPDKTQFDKKSEYYDAKATVEKPRWFCVQVRFVRRFSHFLSLSELREAAELQDMVVLQRGSRLSIQPVTAGDFNAAKKRGLV